jgi:Leucine-rich repeat (LRR) protein
LNDRSYETLISMIITCLYRNFLSLLLKLPILSSYGCNAKDFSVNTRNTRIDGITGFHKPNQGNGDVLTFYTYQSNARFLPKFLGSAFKNLETISIMKSQLSLIEFRDFKYMDKLKRLHLSQNRISTLSPCVFRYSKNLEVIDLSGNLISHIKEETFTSLLNLRKIYLQHNQISRIDENFRKIIEIDLVDLYSNDCVNVCFGCPHGIHFRDFLNMTEHSCGTGLGIR